MESSSSTRRASPARVFAGLALCSVTVLERSMKASSMESGSTSGVSSSIIARTWRPTAAYFFMSGLTTTASGQTLRAWNMGIAECTP